MCLKVVSQSIPRVSALDLARRTPPARRGRRSPQRRGGSRSRPGSLCSSGARSSSPMSNWDSVTRRTSVNSLATCQFTRASDERRKVFRKLHAGTVGRPPLLLVYVRPQSRIRIRGPGGRFSAEPQGPSEDCKVGLQTVMLNRSRNALGCLQIETTLPEPIITPCKD